MSGGDSGSGTYQFDNVFGPEWSTSQVYAATAQHLISKVVEGFNATVFAYGQTSSGKTHTMRGTADEPGLIPTGVREAFDIISARVDREFLLRVSYMEVRADHNVARDQFECLPWTLPQLPVPTHSALQQCLHDSISHADMTI